MGAAAGAAFRVRQRLAILNGAPEGCSYDFEPPEPESLKEPTSSRWLTHSRLPGPETIEPAQPVTYVTDKQTGYAFGLKPCPVRHDRNYRRELNSRSKLREKARHDASAFLAALPADILDRVLLYDGDDVPNGAPIRHPALIPAWSDSFGDSKHMVAPRLEHNASPGLALGAAAIAAEVAAARHNIPVVNIHGVKLGLRCADRGRSAAARSPAAAAWRAKAQLRPDDESAVALQHPNQERSQQ